MGVANLNLGSREWLVASGRFYIRAYGNVQKFGGLARSDESCGDGVLGNEGISERRDLWIDESDSPSSGICSEQYSRGQRQIERQGLCSFSFDSKWFTERTGNTDVNSRKSRIYEQRKARENNQTNRLSRSLANSIKKIARKITTSHSPLATSQVGNGGFTLIELVVYMAIMGFIIIVAGRVFSDSTKMRVRSQNMIKNSEEIGKISGLIKEDISQMGVKAWGLSASSGYTIEDIGTSYQEIYWSANSTPRDSSSYALKHNKRADGTFYDSIVFRKAAFDGDGKFLGIREIAWVAREDFSLVRRCATKRQCASPTVCGTDSDLSVCKVASSVADVEPVLISKNVVNFKIIPSKPGVKDNTQDTLFGANNEIFELVPKVGGDAKDLTRSLNGDVVTVSGLAQNYSETGNGKAHNLLYLLTAPAGNDASNCKKSTFIKGETYAIEFKMLFPSISAYPADSLVIKNSPQFIPGRDHLAIGLRKNDGTKFDEAPTDILFYPPQSESDNDLPKHHLEFSVKNDVSNACVVIIAAFYPPSTITASTNNGILGILKFSGFKIFRKSDEAFHFPDEADYGTEAITDQTKKINQKTNVKAFQLFLEMENRGEKSGTYSENGKGMVITTPNNGIVPK